MLYVYCLVFFSDSLSYALAGDTFEECRKESVSVEEFREAYARFIVDDTESIERKREPGRK